MWILVIGETSAKRWESHHKSGNLHFVDPCTKSCLTNMKSSFNQAMRNPQHQQEIKRCLPSKSEWKLQRILHKRQPAMILFFPWCVALLDQFFDVHDMQANIFPLFLVLQCCREMGRKASQSLLDLDETLEQRVNATLLKRWKTWKISFLDESRCDLPFLYRGGWKALWLHLTYDLKKVWEDDSIFDTRTNDSSTQRPKARDKSLVVNTFLLHTMKIQRDPRLRIKVVKEHLRRTLNSMFILCLKHKY